MARTRYGAEIELERVLPLLEQIASTCSEFDGEVVAFLNFLDSRKEREVGIRRYSIPSGSGVSGTPMSCTVLMPRRTSVFARSVAPVRSSAMAPSRTGILSPHGTDRGSLAAASGATSVHPGASWVKGIAIAPPAPKALPRSKSSLLQERDG